MTILIADNSPRISYTATSGQTAFTVPFEFFDNTDLNVYINDTLQTLTTHYAVTGGSGSTGSITLVTGATAGDVIVITRDVTLERTTDFPTSGPFQVASLNTELDKVVAMIADMKDLADRGLRLSDSDTSATLVLANKDTRKGTVLAFNETTGAVEVGPTIADTNTIAQIKADIALLADIQDGTVATNAITTVSSISPNVTTVAGISSQVTTVSGLSSQVTTVAANDSNITTVAGQTTNMQNVTDNLTAIQNAATNAANAASSASDALSHKNAAETAESNAQGHETNASGFATTAQGHATTAQGHANTATTKAGEASTSASNALLAQQAAESARDSTLASFDSFDDRYLGTKTSDPTVDNDGDALVAGALYFNSTDGEMKVYNGTSWVDAYADGASFVAKSGDTMTGALTINADLTVDTDTLHVDSTNDCVGIGTSSPSNGLHVKTADGVPSGLTGTEFLDKSNARFNIQSGTGSLFIADAGSNNVMMQAASASGTVGENILINPYGGLVGIGLTSPQEVLHVDGNARVGDNTDISMSSTSDGQLMLDGNGYTGAIALNADGMHIYHNSSSRYISFGINETEEMRLETDGDLHVDGNVVAYSTTISDIRLKKDIAPIEDAVTKVQQLNGCTFTYLKDDRKSAGLIAQDVEKVLPSAVIEDEAVFHGEEGETYKTVQYDQVIGLLVEAVKELKAEIEDLKNGTAK
tara:strand:- start:880 stop:2991 length:2112 start_codon:yes stop_codon:yes gene_type:complete